VAMVRPGEEGTENVAQTCRYYGDRPAGVLKEWSWRYGARGTGRSGSPCRVLAAADQPERRRGRDRFQYLARYHDMASPSGHGRS
jgi:hypothetical protein